MNRFDKERFVENILSIIFSEKDELGDSEI